MAIETHHTAEAGQVARKVYNFNPGPAILPRPVLERAQAELLDYRGTGVSILEVSHRGEEYEAINAEAEARLKRLLGLGEEHRVLFLQGGASLQFAMAPMNLLREGLTADYIITGTWSQKARDEAAKLGRVHVAASTEAEGFRRVPTQAEISLSERPVYVHLTSNNTIWGTQWHEWPDVGEAPLVADMSSDILSRPLDASRFALIYAGAQKNMGPAGATVVIARADFLQGAPQNLPTVLKYSTHAKANSLYNTPPVFAVYLTNLVLGWIEEEGGLQAMGERNERKARSVYAAIDQSGGYYRGHAEEGSRSTMNVTFRLPSEDLEKRFVREATEAGLVGLAGHRSVGGVRASLYNAMDLEGCEALASFMGGFARRNG
jgi:phosphoserine aminotransferase